jgi:hypothetical protein
MSLYMADYEGHIKGGLIAFGILFFFLAVFHIAFGSFAFVEYPVFFGLCLFGAMWPDTDTGSKSQIVIYTIFLVVDIFLIFVLNYYKEAAVFGLFAMLPAISKHRGWTHSPKWIIVTGLPLLSPSFLGNDFLIDVRVYEYRNLIFFGVPYYLSFLIGAFSHVALDRSMTLRNRVLGQKNKKSEKKKEYNATMSGTRKDPKKSAKKVKAK